ncbi:o-succinylbenzoate--CoA ligase [Tengunoibacter tsumagoiensis]|nr:o-succinylbenzoate--CoA ligase [Tengunoibacter tsumagoiensis]
MNTTDSSTILSNWLARSAENRPQHLAIACNGLRWTFSELDRQATLLAEKFALAGIGAQSRIAVLTGSGLPYVACVHALMRLKAILVPLNLRLTAQELSWQLRDVQAIALLSDLAHQDLARQLAQLLPDLPLGLLHHPSPEVGLTPLVDQQLPFSVRPVQSVAPLNWTINLADTQAIMYTSGTTGTPKGVVLTYGMHWWNAVGSALNLGHQLDDIWLACMPLFHVGGLSILMRSVINGISVILQEKFEPAVVNQTLIDEKVTIISVVAIMLQRMLAELDTREPGGRYPEALRCVLLGGGPAPRPLLEDCASRKIPVVQTYGLTESASQAVTLAPGDALRKLGSAGRPLLPVQLSIRNEGQVAAPNEPGIICLKGPGITPGYDHRPEATAQAIVDGWLSTGDIGYLDEEGYLYVLDRRSDLIISGGENIYPAEIEAALLAHPDVQEAGVCGQADTRWGQIPIAFVHLQAQSVATAEQLLAYTEQRLARYKVPRALYIVGPLPRNASGKLLRRELNKLRPPSSS